MVALAQTCRPTSGLFNLDVGLALEILKAETGLLPFILLRRHGSAKLIELAERVIVQRSEKQFDDWHTKK